MSFSERPLSFYTVRKYYKTWLHNNLISFAGKNKGLSGGSANTQKMILNKFAFVLRCLKIGQLLEQVSRRCDFPASLFIIVRQLVAAQGKCLETLPRQCPPPSGEHTGHPHTICCCPKAQLSPLLLRGSLTYNSVRVWVEQAAQQSMYISFIKHKLLSSVQLKETR